VARRHNVYVISDEIYERFAYDFPVPSIVNSMGEAMLLGGFSKTYAMTGWRLGFAAGPKEILEQMTKLQQYTFVCAPSIAQEADWRRSTATLSVCGPVSGERDLIYNGLLQAGYEVTKPHGPSTYSPKLPGGRTRSLWTCAIRNNVLVIPGLGLLGETHPLPHFVRHHGEQIERGIELLAKLKDRPASTNGRTP